MEIELIERPTSTAIAEYSPTAAALAELKSRLADVAYDVSTGKGMDIAKKDRAEVRGLRTALEAKRVELKAPALERSRLIDAEAKALTAELVALETPIDQQIKAEENRKAAEKAAKEQAEREKSAMVQRELDSIKEGVLCCVGMPAFGIAMTREALAKVEISLELFGERAGEAAQAKAQALAKLDEMHAAALAREAEEARLVAERAEMARLRAEQEARDKAERERIAAEQKAEADRLAAERKAFEQEQAAARAEAKKLEDADRARRDEEDRKAREARATEDKRIADARAVLEAEQRAARKVEQDRINAEAAIERKRLDDEAAEARRLADEAHRAEEQRRRDERAAEEAAAAKKRKAEAKAAAKLAQAQKCAPRLLLALHAAYDECAQLPEGTVSAAMMDEAIAAINEAEGVEA